ncbi:MAG TPA: hypothetical protein V6C90_21430 [Coleofasciculaceae cyanobacterium]
MLTLVPRYRNANAPTVETMRSPRTRRNAVLMYEKSDRSLSALMS